MGNTIAAKREVLMRERDTAGRKLAVETLQKTTWHGKLEELKTLIEGTVHLPSDEDGKYTEARSRAWNMDQRGFPFAIVRVKHTADVVATIRFLRAHVPSEVSVCVAGGCHSSRSINTNCIVIDLVNINQVSFDSATGRVNAGGGCYLKDIDELLEPYNRAVPIGTYPMTGVGGLSLGGGFGWLTRMFGLTVDNFVEAEVVLSDGRVVIANDDNEYSDLMWGLRGGGGNFGIVTRFTFQSHELPPVLLTGTIVKLAPTHSAAKTVLMNFDKVVPDIPANLSSGLVLPAGAPVVVTLWAHFGTETNPAKIPILRDAPNFGGWPTMENSVKKKSYARDLQHFTEPMNPSGFDYHTVIPIGSLQKCLTEDFIDRLLTYTRKSPPAKVQQAAVIILSLSDKTEGGRDSNNERTAIPRAVRDARYFVLAQASWQVEFGDEGKAAAKDWVKGAFEILKSYGMASVYAPDEVNTHEQKLKLTAENIFGYTDDLFQRLSALKGKYDPENFYHMNTNIKPPSQV